MTIGLSRFSNESIARNSGGLTIVSSSSYTVTNDDSNLIVTYPGAVIQLPSVANFPDKALEISRCYKEVGPTNHLVVNPDGSDTFYYGQATQLPSVGYHYQGSVILAPDKANNDWVQIGGRGPRAVAWRYLDSDDGVLNATGHRLIFPGVGSGNYDDPWNLYPTSQYCVMPFDGKLLVKGFILLSSGTWAGSAAFNLNHFVGANGTDADTSAFQQRGSQGLSTTEKGKEIFFEKHLTKDQRHSIYLLQTSGSSKTAQNGVNKTFINVEIW